MQPRSVGNATNLDLFRNRLDNIINMKHEIVILSDKIDWSWIEENLKDYYLEKGRPGAPIRLLVGILILKYMNNLSDEEVCALWKENPYYQYFTGEKYFQHELPIDRSTLSYFRKRIDEKFLENILSESLRVAHDIGAIDLKDCERVAVDTTVQEKAVCYPTDAKLYYKAIISLGSEAEKANIDLRQSYKKVSKRALVKFCRYRHAKQMKRANGRKKFLKVRLGRLIRDISRKLNDDNASVSLIEALEKCKKIHTQDRGTESKKKIFSYHAPEVECIGKGKVSKPYEFGCKVSIATNVNSAKGGHFVLHCNALHGNPFDGHTLKYAIERITSLVGVEPKRIYVDNGYRGHNYDNKLRVYKSGQKRGIFGQIKKELRRRTVIEPIIGHVKNDCRMDRNYLKGQHGDKVNALLSGVAYNFRKVLAWIRNLLLSVLRMLGFQEIVIYIQPKLESSYI